MNYLEVSSYENAKLYSLLSEACGQSPLGVPALFIDKEMILGYDDDEHMGVRIRKEYERCLKEDCVDPRERLGIVENVTDSNSSTQCEDTTIQIPFFGELDGAKMSLPVFTVVIGFLDGFNPCAFFVLFFLLSLLIHAESRFRMFLIGGIFVFFSGAIYFVFMAAWMNFFLIIGQLKMITKIAGVIALIVAFLNIKDFFWFKKGASLGIPESAKKYLYSQMREIVKATQLWSMILGTAILAIAANTYELLCTAGFPMVYTRVLTLNNLTPNTYYMYLALYNVVYVLPLFAIVCMFTFTLGSRKLKEEEGQVLKLLSGMMMLSLGSILLFMPELLNNIMVAIGILVFAIITTSIITFLKHTAKDQKTNVESVDKKE